MRLNRFTRRHVNRLHKPLWFVGADRQERDPGMIQTMADLLEVWTEGGIGSEVDGICRRCDPVSTPKRTITIRDPTGREMPGRDRCDRACRIPPVQLFIRTDAISRKQGCDSERNNKGRIVSLCEPFERGQIQMIVVIVTDQNEIDSRERFERYAGRRETARTER